MEVVDGGSFQRGCSIFLGTGNPDGTDLKIHSPRLATNMSDHVDVLSILR
jgi:hypothetical protein